MVAAWRGPSRGRRPSIGAVRAALLVLPLAGAALLVAAELSVLYEIHVEAAVPAGGTFRAGPHHGYALAVIAAAAVALALVAVLGGSRSAAVALLVLGAAALAVVLAVDLPDVHETGLVGQTYEAARAEPRSALWLELAGAGCLLCGAVAILGEQLRH
jgi:hypothetical protein